MDLFGYQLTPLVFVAAIAGLVGLGLLLLFAAIRNLLYICPPNQVLIFSGRRHRMPDGTTRGYRVVFGGRGWRVPIIESVARMNLNVMEVPIAIRGAYSKGGIPLNVDAIANVKISSHEVTIGNAIERFLNRDPEEIRRVAKETLEGHLRGVLARLMPEEVNEDRLKFASELSQESEEDLSKLGIHLDTLKILHVSDEVQYLDSIGRQAIATVVKEAEIAESDAKREAELVEAESRGRASVTQANVDAMVLQMQNDLRKIKADLEAKVQSEEEITKAAAREARATAEQELQVTRAELASIRLQAERVLPAEAERGRAVGKALERIENAWQSAGNDALRIYLIEELEKILTSITQGVKKIQIEDLSLVDGGSGKLFSNYVAAYPAMVSAIFDAVAKTTGIDIPKVVSGETKEKK